MGHRKFSHRLQRQSRALVGLGEFSVPHLWRRCPAGRRGKKCMLKPNNTHNQTHRRGCGSLFGIQHMLLTVQQLQAQVL